MNVIKLSESFYQNNINKLIFDLPVFCIKLIENKIKRYIGLTPMTSNKLRTAVKLWCKNKEDTIIKYGHISNWNVQNITDMSSMFFNCNYFNQPLNNWDVSNVTNMSCMFSNCGNFNQPLNNWDVSNVTGMICMFNWCFSFNQPINNWDVSNVTNMRYMFHTCKMKNPFE